MESEADKLKKRLDKSPNINENLKESMKDKIDVLKGDKVVLK